MKNALKFHFENVNDYDGLIIGKESDKVMECLALETGKWTQRRVEACRVSKCALANLGLVTKTKIVMECTPFTKL